MSDVLQDFLRQRLPQPGVVAWSARLKDRTLKSECFSDWFKPAQVEQALNRMTLAVEGFRPYGIQPVRLCWVFDRARVHLALRPDAACLGLFVENREGAAAGAVEEVLADFTALTLR